MEENMVMNEVTANVVEEVTENLPEVAEEALPTVVSDVVPEVPEAIDEVPRFGIGPVIAVGAAGVVIGALLYTGGKWAWKKGKAYFGKSRSYAKVASNEAEEDEFADEYDSVEAPIAEPSSEESAEEK